MVLRVTFVGLTFILTAEYWVLDAADAVAADADAEDCLFWLVGSSEDFVASSAAVKIADVEILRHLSI